MIPKISIYDLLHKDQFPNDEGSLEKGPMFFYTNFASFYVPIELLKKVNGNISLYELMILNFCFFRKNPGKTLELGTFNGRTTLSFFYNSLGKNMIYTVDLPSEKALFTKLPIEKGQTKVGSIVYDELGYIGHKKIFDEDIYSFSKNRIKQVWKDTGELVSEDLDKHSFDFIFVDASHSYENVKHDIHFSLSVANKNAVILFHDYGDVVHSGWIGVYNALNEFYNTEILSEQSSMEIFHIEDTSLVVLLV